MKHDQIKLTHYVKAAGCAAKVPSGDLELIGQSLIQKPDPRLLVGFEGNEDCGVYQMDENLALVQTVDFITPLVDDPFAYGQIAAANAISDVYAMGGRPITALNILLWDRVHLSGEIVSEILKGGLSKIQEAGAVLLGGHSIEDTEQKYGLSVTGVVHPAKIWRNNTPKTGDALVLSKPLGMGILTSAIKVELIGEGAKSEATRWMTMLNKRACEIALGYEIHACTDVTGFGLSGHLLEMCANATARVFVEKVPYVEEALKLAKMGIIPAGTYKNERFASGKVRFETQMDEDEKMILFDAQTSGGLLFALPKDQSHKLVDALKSAGYEYAAVIGEFVPDRDHRIVFC